VLDMCFAARCMVALKCLSLRKRAVTNENSRRLIVQTLRPNCNDQAAQFPPIKSEPDG